uniref:tRNA-guanine(15) transglycosylase-like domain-containing protein n=1 Tax=Piliocolobus tephrosceles TaxID=591936 RepID=A0A8C9H4S5_9PRIM
MENDLVNKKSIVSSKNLPKSAICLDTSFEESNIKKKRKKNKKNDDENISNVNNDNYFEKYKHEEPMMFDFLTEQDYNNYNKCELFFKNHFENIDMKNINEVVTKLRNEKDNIYLSNYVSSSSDSEGGDVTECNDKRSGEYKKNLKLINLNRSKRARLNVIVIKKKYISGSGSSSSSSSSGAHNTVIMTPIFMPVGTKSCIKGLLSEEVENLCKYIILSNTYHLSNIYDMDTFKKNKDINNFIKFPNSVLTDSGGFQMVSLSKRIKILEEGIVFNNIYDSYNIKKNIDYLMGRTTNHDMSIYDANPVIDSINSNVNFGTDTISTVNNASTTDKQYVSMGEDILLSPEISIRLQNYIGADIIMALDDVRSALEPDIKKIEDATYRTNRWLVRCIKSHQNKNNQTLFGIIQGGLNINLRNKSMDFIIRQKLNGYAVGGLCGGEKKKKFIEIIHHCSNEKVNKKYNYLPINKCRYIMGIGYIIDILLCSIFGYDMFDCVYPTRTARFNTALSFDGTIKLKQAQYKYDFTPIVKHCKCYVCMKYTRASIHMLISKKNPIVNILLTIHNIFFILHFCYLMRVSIFSNKIDYFVTTVLYNNFVIGVKNGNYKIPDDDKKQLDTSYNQQLNGHDKEWLDEHDQLKINEKKKKQNYQNINNMTEQLTHCIENEKKIKELKNNLPFWLLQALQYANIELKF